MHSARGRKAGALTWSFCFCWQGKIYGSEKLIVVVVVLSPGTVWLISVCDMKRDAGRSWQEEIPPGQAVEACPRTSRSGFCCCLRGTSFFVIRVSSTLWRFKPHSCSLPPGTTSGDTHTHTMVTENAFKHSHQFPRGQNHTCLRITGLYQP